MLSKIIKLEARHQTIFAVIIAFAVILFWRGVWGLMDLYLIPENAELSFLVSIAVGLGILVATHYVTKELM
jgi:hypothetical protein